MSTFTVRPSNSEKEAFRVKLTAASLLSLKLKIGCIVLLQPPDDDGSTPRPAIAWENSGSGMKDTIVQVSRVLQELYGLKLGDRIGIVRTTETLTDATSVIVRPLSTTFSDSDQTRWQAILSVILYTKHNVLTPSQILSIEHANEKGEFEVVDVGGLLGRVTKATEIVLQETKGPSADGTATTVDLDFTGIGGLQHQIDQVNKHFKRLLSPLAYDLFPDYQQKQGLLLYGPKGTGKTVFQKALSRSGWASVHKWSAGAELPRAKYPQLIMVDLSGITGNAKAISELVALFETVWGTQTLIVAEARHPNDIDERLRSMSTFSVELELPIPTADQRLDILRALRGRDEQPSHEQIQDLASRTHGFVGADLNVLVGLMRDTALDRAIANASLKQNEHLVTSDNDPTTVTASDESTQEATDNTDTILQSDIDHALSQTRPSALQEIFLDKPSIRWTDIGGQQELKRQLVSAVTRLLHEPSRRRMESLGLTPTKGILLYGPPGCSKTLLVKALATEASLNFLAVKGAELISMYVGESERATREVFRKARAAAPAILFFDEIDAIASRTRSGSDLNVLTTLLNEMDGFEELRGVLVVAATNKPQAIDPALLRPGRFDKVVYVGLPDRVTRREIIEKYFRHTQSADGFREVLDDFAERCEGFSGAEVVEICRAAGERAFDAERDYYEVEDMEEAIRSTAMGVSQETLQEYEQWNNARKSM